MGLEVYSALDWLSLEQDASWNAAEGSVSLADSASPLASAAVSIARDVAEGSYPAAGHREGQVRGKVPVKFPPPVFTGNSCSGNDHCRPTAGQTCSSPASLSTHSAALTKHINALNE